MLCNIDFMNLRPFSFVDGISEKPRKVNKEAVYVNYEIPMDTQSPPFSGENYVTVM